MSKMSKEFDELLALGEMEMFLEKVKQHTESKIRGKQLAGTEVDDVVQEVLIKVYQSVELFDSNKASAATYFDRIIDNKIRDCLRLMGTETNLAFVNSASIVDDRWYTNNGASELTENEVVLAGDCSTYSCVEYIYDIVNNNMGLTEKEMQIFKLRAAGYNFVEIAHILGYTKARISQLWKGIIVKFETLGK